MHNLRLPLLRILAACTIIAAIYLLTIFGKSQGWFDRSPALKVITPPMPLAMVSKNLSGITWNKETNTLFAVTNSPQEIIELTPEGRTLRKITLEGFSDTEDIAHLGGSRFAVVEERLGYIRMFDLTDQTQTIQIQNTQGIDLGSRHPDNKGFESLYFDSASKTFFTMLEIAPFDLLSVPLDSKDATSMTRQHLDIRVKDVAAIDRDPQGRFWLLSQASHSVVIIDQNREILKMSIMATNNKFEPEGLCFGPGGRVYMVGEPNLFGVYALPERHKDTHRTNM